VSDVRCEIPRAPFRAFFSNVMRLPQAKNFSVNFIADCCVTRSLFGRVIERSAAS